MSNVKEAPKKEQTSKHTQANDGKDEATKTSDKLHEKENKKDPSLKDGQTTDDPTEEKEKPTKLKHPENAYKEEPTKEQKIINYIANSPTEKVDLVPLLKSLYPLATFSEPAAYQHQNEAKRLRVMLMEMVADRRITMYDDNYLKLGRNFYAENDPKTRYHTIDSVKIIAVK